ncbi:ATP-dependent DNA helicase [Sphingomicrobium lutaoense]|uniref:ATP-dependent DNA helicase DinG n=1 Tax=Sphingomicrobium lutaoense TaxID=515949 RepID=A0A839YZ18_9SPHN|nr:ATP-dependent DNA helicase [Sphingomicrobium lutaoense]MBB3763017.1 ATP-dependent DNA helicase DinG [Sphingomicrobium lutaoense]
MASLPALPALHATHAGIWRAAPDGEVRALGRGEAISLLADTPHILLNAPLIGERLGAPEISGLDLLELFAFLHPARFAVPTVAGMARAAGLEPPEDDAGAAPLLRVIASRLLSRMEEEDWPEREGAWTTARTLQRHGWPWAPLVAARLKTPAEAERALFSRLSEWEENADPVPPRHATVSDADAREKLARLVGEGAETRQGQQDMAGAVAGIFAPREEPGQPHMLLADAGTGIGKTLAYLAPAALWADRSGGTAWISTYTKALQRQLDAEGKRLFPDRAERERRIVVRKGRENYLCLLNLEDAMQGGFGGRAAILAQLVGRWAAYSKDGDMVGGDLPGWLTSLFRRAGATALTDRRGECIYAGCPHFRRCFIEKAERAGREADLVIANHALVMVNAARQKPGAPTRILFDEGHHLFDAADSTFAAALTGREAIELRRWIIGPEGKSRGRQRGLEARLMDVASYDEEGGAALGAAVEAARQLNGDGWLARIAEGDPWGPLERLLAAVRSTTYARASAQDAGYGIETELAEPDGALVDAAAEALEAMEAIAKPLAILSRRLEALLEDAPDWLDAQARARVEGSIHSLGWRRETLGAWMAMLARIGGPVDPDFVDWLAIARVEGREYDIGLHRHWLDPTRPLAKAVLEPAHGVLVTSATLRNGGDWDSASARSGALHLSRPARTFEAQSPFDYAASTEVLIVNDLGRGDIPQLAGAYARLIEAAGGGTLGLFTAIKRLRAVHARIADRLARAGLPLYAQHVDPIDTGTLVDIFRDDPRASLLGTDALRDGVDVPGDSLRMVVMERVPWARPTVLHGARRLVGGGSAYDDKVVKARLAQAYGRLVRREGDRGFFVLLSAATPSRLLTAFPEGVAVHRLPLDEAVARVRDGLAATREKEDAPCLNS